MDDLTQLPCLQSPHTVPWEDVLQAMPSVSKTVDTKSEERQHGTNICHTDNRSSSRRSGAESNCSGKEVLKTYCRRTKRQRVPVAHDMMQAPSRTHAEATTVSSHATDALQRRSLLVAPAPSAQLLWQGKQYVPDATHHEVLPRTIFDPIPVRIPSTALLRLPNRASASSEGDWVLGLAIHSYVLAGHRELLYVILLDDGSELHLPCGEVEHISIKAAIANDYPTTNDSAVEERNLAAHPSSMEIDATSEDVSIGKRDLAHSSYRHSFSHTSINTSHGVGSAFSYDDAVLSQLLPSATHSFMGIVPPMISSVKPVDCKDGPAYPTLPNTEVRTLAQCDAAGTILEDSYTTQNRESRPHFTSLFEQVLLDSIGKSRSVTSIRQEARQGRHVPRTIQSNETLLLPFKSKASDNVGSVMQSTPANEEALRDHVHRSQGREDATQAHKRHAEGANNTEAHYFENAALKLECGKGKATVGGPNSQRLQATSDRRNGSLRATHSRLASARLTAHWRCVPRQLGGDGAVALAPKLNDDIQGLLVSSRQVPTNPNTMSGSAATVGTTYVSDGRRTRCSAGRGNQGLQRQHRLNKAAEATAFAHEFREDSWTTEHATYIHDPVRFTGPTGGPSFPFRRMPTKLSLFNRFWNETTLSTICAETNRYASEVDEDTGLPMGGPYWWALTVDELRAFLGISLMMGIKRLPNHRAYWSKQFPFLYCQMIASTMSKSRYEDITRCLHVSNDNNDLPNHGHILSKLGWLIAEMKSNCKRNWNLNQHVTVDESMIRYKGKYCPIRQYLPQKPTKWGIKVWALADASKYYIYDFDVYTGSLERASLRGFEGGAGKSGYDVVMTLMTGLHGRGHVVVTDNFFTSVKLVVNLAALGTFATGTVRSNRIGLPKTLAVKRLFAGQPRGTLGWRMHCSRKLSCVVWVDKRPVLLLSSFFTPLPRFGEEWPTVPRRENGEERNVDTSPVHKGYTEYMRGVDVADQMRNAYSAQVKSHKWWHRVFFFLLDTTVVNAYILYKSICEGLDQEPVHRSDFQLLLAQTLCKPWRLKRGCVSQFRLATPAVHSLVRTNSRRKCRFCSSNSRTNMCCEQCGGVHLHMGECFRRSHYILRR